jgi:hypothetical protein
MNETPNTTATLAHAQEFARSGGLNGSPRGARRRLRSGSLFRRIGDLGARYYRFDTQRPFAGLTTHLSPTTKRAQRSPVTEARPSRYGWSM